MNKKCRYKNNSENDLTLPEIGLVKAGETIEQPDGFNNANFEKVGEARDRKPEIKPENKEVSGENKLINESKKQ